MATHLVRRLLAADEEVIVVANLGSFEQEGVRVMVGDAAKIDFGLSGELYGELCRVVRRVTVVEITEHLSAAQLRYHDLESARPIRVAAEVSEFAAQSAQLESLVYLSSFAVFGEQKGLVFERDFPTRRTFSQRRDEVLAIAEKQIHRVGHVAPTAVVRIASLAGSEVSGEILIGSDLARLAQFAAAAPDECEFIFSDRPVHFETVERTVEVLIRVQPLRPLVALHLVDDDPWTDRQLVSWIFERIHKRVVEAQPGVGAMSQLLRAASTQPGRVPTAQADFERAEAVRQLGGLMNRDVNQTLLGLFGQSSMTGIVA